MDKTALFTGLEELIVVVSDGYHRYFHEGEFIGFDESTVEKKKQELRDRLLEDLRTKSALEIPQGKVVRDDEIDKWKRWEARRQRTWVDCHDGGGRCREMIHRKNCHRKYIMERREHMSEL